MANGKVDGVSEIGSAGERIEKAMDVIARYGQIDGAHHKAWIIDQVTRALLGDGYGAFVEEMRGETEENGEREYDWYTGIAP